MCVQSLGDLVKSADSDSIGLGWGLRVCISIKLPHDAGPPSTDHTLCNRVVINKNFKVILFWKCLISFFFIFFPPSFLKWLETWRGLMITQKLGYPPTRRQLLCKSFLAIEQMCVCGKGTSFRASGFSPECEGEWPQWSPISSWNPQPHCRAGFKTSHPHLPFIKLR